ncbi:MAG: beta-lactamase family protein [Armatimonadetes bacterium]|nr:beta-lactamase family protein [Armatimonadota bacterium]
MEVRLAICLLVVCCLATTASAAGIKPEGYIRQWTILGPFPNPERPATQKDRGAFDIDYLKSLGGESKSRIKPDTVVLTSSEAAKTIRVAAKSVKLDGDVLDFIAQYTDTDYKLAYAYTEIESPKAQEALFFLGSDDAVKVWVNGKLAHENFIQRAAVARSDRFSVRLKKGANSILAKVENGIGGWALIMEVYASAKADEITAEIQAAENARAFLREEIDTVGPWNGYVFWNGWMGPPAFEWRHPDRVKELEGDIPLTVRWFDSSLNEVKAAEKPGRYMVYLEGKMKDGTPVRRAVTTYCDPPEGIGLDGTAKVTMPYPGKPFDEKTWAEIEKRASSDADRILRDAIIETENGAKFVAALFEAKPTGAPATVTESAAVLADDYQLALKLKLLGLTDKARKLAAPKTLDKPFPVLHEGKLAEAGMQPDAKEKIDAICKKWAEDSGEPFTILVARHGVIVTEAAFGPVGLDYRTDVMSITKAVSGMLFSRFLDQGYCKLDDPIGKVVPGFPTKGDHMLTYRQLFTHTSGFEGHGEWGGIHNPWLDNVALNGLAAVHPGRQHVYNGMGYDLAAKAMEYMTGKSIVRLFHEDLFRPMGINDVPLDDLAYGANLTSRELGILAQLWANRGSYGDKQFISRETFETLLPTDLSKYYPGIKVDWGIGLTWMPEHKPGAPFMSLDPKDLIFGPHTIGHGSASSCILRVDLDHDLIVVQIRRTAGPKYGEYALPFFQTIADEML